MARPLTRAQALENAAFLKALRRTGNIRLAAREAGIAPATLHTRRARHPDFAQRWDVAVVMANARFHEKGGRMGPVAARGAGEAQAAHRTRGGEPVVVRCRDGRLQVRAAQPGKLTTQCEQAFLAALSATANVRLSAAAAGASVAAFYRRRRNNPAFAREMRLALQSGYEQIEAALLAAAMPDSHEDDAWRQNEPPPIPAMTPSQALQLLYLHQKEARLSAKGPLGRLRPGETRDMQCARLAERYREGLAERAEDETIRKVLGRDRWRPARERAVVLPALDQVGGWSRADPAKAPHDPERALFGGWRMADMERRKGEG